MEQERFPGTEKEEHSIFPMFCDDWGHDLIWKETSTIDLSKFPDSRSKKKIVS